MTLRVFRHGSALITCTLILVIVSVIAVGLAATSGVNLQIADNQHWANSAFASAESGLEVSRYWLSQIRISSATPPENYLGAIIAAVDVNLADHGVSNFRVEPDGAIPSVVLNPLPGYTFQGQWSPSGTAPDVIRITTCGISGLMSRTINVDYRILPYYFSIFDYGIATKGPLVVAQNANFLSATQAWEADIYIASDSVVPIDIGMSGTFSGDVLWANPAGVASYDSLSASGDFRALDPSQGETPPEFAVPGVEDFAHYATGPVIDSTTDLSGASSTWANALIKAGTNPRFGGSVTIQGILYIEAPNKVTFPKSVTLQGMIVANGKPDLENAAGNEINIGDPLDPKTPSNFSSGPYPAGAQFDDIRKEEGACILAPGFKVAFWKNYSSVNGVIAASGVIFDWNSSSTIKGTIINYSSEPLSIRKNVTMTFDRSGMVKIPAGFDLYRVPVYDPGSYALAY